jgi:hypothetical protein
MPSYFAAWVDVINLLMKLHQVCHTFTEHMKPLTEAFTQEAHLIYAWFATIAARLMVEVKLDRGYVGSEMGNFELTISMYLM